MRKPVFLLTTCLLIANGSMWLNAAVVESFKPDSASGAKMLHTLDMKYGLENLIRIDDFDSNPNDQYWMFSQSDGIGKATAIAKFAGFKHEFGILPGSEGSDFLPLFSSGGSHFGWLPSSKNGPRFGKLRSLMTGSRFGKLHSSMSKSFSEEDAGSVFRFALDITTHPGYRWSSAINDNLVMPNGAAGDGIDHMVTFQLKGTDTYILGWEDLMVDNTWYHFDGDYGDLIVEVSGVQPFIPTQIPEPTPFILLAMSGVMMIRKPTRYQ